MARAPKKSTTRRAVPPRPKRAPARAAAKAKSARKAPVKRAARGGASKPKRPVSKPVAAKKKGAAKPTKVRAAKVSTRRAAKQARTVTARPAAKPVAKPVAKSAPAPKAPVKRVAPKAPAAVSKPAPAVKPVAVKAAPKPEPVKELPKKPRKPELTPKEIATIRAALLDQRAVFAREFTDIEEGAFNVSQSEMSGEVSFDEEYADAGSFTFEREKELSIGNNIRDLLDKVDHALAAIAKGTYGICENCGDPINKARLLALPYSTMCIRCKQQDERTR